MRLLKRLAITVAVIALVMMQVNAQGAVEVSSSASSAILFEPSSGRVLFEQQAHVKRPMASTTKLMTALLAAECIPQDAVLTATWDAVNVEGTSLGLQVGDTIARDDLLYGLLLSSGNDAANVAALSIDDSFEAFAERMNARATQLGMRNSCFVTPSGLDEGDHGASAYDMALLAREVLKNELLATICATDETTVTVGGRRVGLSNHNRLLREYDGAVGMKTGYTSKAGRCLVSAATRDGVTLIAVTLDCSDDWAEHKALLDEGFALVEAVTLAPVIPPLLKVFGGQRAAVSLQVLPSSVSLLGQDKEELQCVVSLLPYVWAPVKAGDTLGTVSYYLRGACVASLPVTAGETVEEIPSVPWKTKWKLIFSRLFRQALT